MALVRPASLNTYARAIFHLAVAAAFAYAGGGDGVVCRGFSS